MLKQLYIQFYHVYLLVCVLIVVNMSYGRTNSLVIRIAEKILNTTLFMLAVQGSVVVKNPQMQFY